MILLVNLLYEKDAPFVPVLVAAGTVAGIVFRFHRRTACFPDVQGGSMAFRSTWLAGVAAAAFLLCPTNNLKAAQDKPVAPDNTKVNQRDRSKTAATADQGKDNANDREIMQKIRKSVMDDKNLSTYAHNVKIISQHGKVTLKGPVRSAEEKHAIEQMAAEVAGAGNVSNQLTIKASRSKKSS